MDLFRQFDHLQTLYPPSVARRIARVFQTGLSTRLGSLRMQGLLRTPEAKALVAFLSEQSPDRLKALRVMAALNEEQARDASRRTLIANVTAPLVILAIVNQTFPGWHSVFTADGLQNQEIFVGICLIVGFVVAYGITAFFAITYFNHARDLRHLIDAASATRGVYFGAEDADEPGVDTPLHD